MKCRHRGRNFEWFECPECGKMIRMNRVRDVARWSSIILYILFGAEPAASLLLALFGLDGNPAMHTFLGSVSILVLFELLRVILPYYDEKEEMDA